MNPSMAVAMLALFVALTGSAYAGAKLSKNSVTSKTIKNGAVTGKKIKKKTITATNVKPNTLTGSQINEDSLATVPSAANAANAAKVAGIDGSTLVTKSHLVQWNVAMNRGDAAKTLATFGPWTITGRCEVSGADSSAYVDVTSSKDDTYTPADSDLDANETQLWLSYTNFTPTERDYTTNEPYFLDPSTGISSLDGDGQPVGIWVGFPGADCRFVGSLPVTTP
jgi:hypothetical protein